MNQTGERNHFHSPAYVVEMAGVEPASRRFEQGHTTSLVALLSLTRTVAGQQATAQVSRCEALGLPAYAPTYRRRVGVHSRFSVARLSLPRERQRADVTVRRSDSHAVCLRSERESGLCALFGTFVLPSFYEVQAPRLAVPAQPPLSKPFHPQAGCTNIIPQKGLATKNRLSAGSSLSRKSEAHWATALAGLRKCRAS